MTINYSKIVLLKMLKILNIHYILINLIDYNDHILLTNGKFIYTLKKTNKSFNPKNNIKLI